MEIRVSRGKSATVKLGEMSHRANQTIKTRVRLKNQPHCGGARSVDCWRLASLAAAIESSQANLYTCGVNRGTGGRSITASWKDIRSRIEHERFFVRIFQLFREHRGILRSRPAVLSPPYARGLEMIVDLIPFEPGEPFEFVDLGCGTAEPTARVLYRFRRATGTCVDSEPEMLRIAKRKLTPYSGRVEVKEADITRCTLPSCDMVFSAKTIHHVHPGDLQSLFARISSALRPNGRFILYDTMSVVPGWGAEVRLQSTHYRERHIRNAIESGMVTREEIDARREYKRKMKAAGKDVEYEHRAEDLIRTMNGTGFNDVAVVWRLFADTILLAFVPGKY